MSLIIKGKLKVTCIDINTGKVLDVDEGNNLVLNTGLTSVMSLISGLTIAPSELIGPNGKALNQFNGPVSTIAKYIQFGTNSASVFAAQISPFVNGTLDVSVTDPASASEIIQVTPTLINAFDDSVLSTIIGVNLHAELSKTQGNGPSGTMNYTEAVLMGLSSISPLTYNWFARRAFSGKIKNNTVKLVADWTITCEASEVLT